MPIADNQARVNVTWKGQQGDLPDFVEYGAADGDIFQWVTEAVRAGDIPGIDADPDARFENFIVDRFPAHEEVPHNRLVVRPKTAYGVTS